MTKAAKIARTERSSLYKSQVLPTSVKKVQKILRQIQGKTVSEALVQLRFSPKKVARDIMKGLIVAQDEAIAGRGMGLGDKHALKKWTEQRNEVASTLADLDEQTPKTKGANKVIELKDGKKKLVRDPTEIYIDQAWCGRGESWKSPEFRARGRVNMLTHRTTSFSFLLKEEKTRMRISDEIKKKRDNRKLWVALPDRPVTAQRQVSASLASCNYTIFIKRVSTVIRDGLPSTSTRSMHRSMPPQDLSAAVGRSRSFTGCSTCRTRHTKCDEGRPTCAACRSAGVQCGGPLLSEEERQRMSEWLTEAVSPKAVTNQLNKIDEECEAVSCSEDVSISRGPFGAFKIVQSLSAMSGGLPDRPEDPQLVEGLNHVSDNTVDFTDGSLTPRTRMLFQSLLELPEENTFSSVLPMWSTIDDFARIQEVFDDVDISTNLTSFGQQPLMDEMGHDLQFDGPDHVIPLERFAFSDCMPLTTTNNTIPDDAVHLIKHYSSTVLTVLTPFHHSKTPWHVLFVPHAKSCLAALTLGESLDHASLCAFYATLSISAFSLGGISQSNTWLEQGRTYLKIARDHVRLMLRSAYDYPKTAKYKNILIALLSMVQVAIVIGNRDQAECYFVEAEKFIRMKGLNRKKSRKVRLLHHCYVFERMFHESVYLAGTNSAQRSHARKAIESSGAMAYSQDSLSFRLGDLEDLESRALRVKCREEGENDLHLQNPGLWPKTLYPEIFGIPEKYVFALSLIIRLGQWRDEARHQDAVNALSLTDFLSRAKTVERYIKQLYRSVEGPNPPSTTTSEAQEPMLDDLLQAMQHALTIYFHRRIYDVEAEMLQIHVVAVRNCLLRSETSMVYGSARFLWPAFIAASEAEDPQVQASFTEWFQNSAARSGLPYFNDAKASIERIWEEKQNSHGSHVTWMDFMQKIDATSDSP
ncbi:hypothetical protein OPT61_g6792 [Boeremia exigua]|uniref:Uncharacterized protein n=1 Tax=Boeremia exigua TaxID=749465 RepID=A0ACC2I5W9_9PLEO|nr:hypothetical protein OPT61_g6792 [Boeremia exigua]